MMLKIKKRSLKIFLCSLAMFSLAAISVSDCAKANLTLNGAPLDVTTTERLSKGVWRNGTQQFYGGFHSSALIHLDGVCSSPPSFWGLWQLCVKKYIPISESKVGDTITTVVLDADGKVEITQKVTYINGEEKIRVSWDIENISGASINNVKFSYGADTYFNGADMGHGFWSPSLQMVYILQALGGGGYMAIDPITPPCSLSRRSLSWYSIYDQNGSCE